MGDFHRNGDHALLCIRHKKARAERQRNFLWKNGSHTVSFWKHVHVCGNIRDDIHHAWIYKFVSHE